MTAIVALLLSLVVVSCSTIHSSRSSPPEGFSNTGPAHPDTPLSLRIALNRKDINGLHNVLMEISTPGNPKYGKHLSQAEVTEYVKPTQESLDAVNEYLSSHGVTAAPASPAGDWLKFEVPVSKANEMFGAEYYTFTHSETGHQSVRTLSYSIPQSLENHVEILHPTTSFPSYHNRGPMFSSPLKLSATSGVPDSCNTTITPACLQALYGIPTSLATQSSNRIGVTAFDSQYAIKTDLQGFLKQFRPDLPLNSSFDFLSVDNGQNYQNPNLAGSEANLDIQYTVGLASGVPVTFIAVGRDTPTGDVYGFIDVANTLLNMTAPPQVLSTSYGYNEQDFSIELVRQVCDTFAQLGARGVSVIFASGDGAVSGSQDNTQCTKFVPTVPSGCPFLTSVGATSGVPETAAPFSSGGFSNYFPVPDYQASAVSSYLQALGSTNQGLYNASGRGFPDVSAQGARVAYVNRNETDPGDGSSFSAPIFASVISLLNDQLIAAGKSPLGFLNPFLYSTGASALNDITTGSNPGCNTNGFPAGPGWDPVTGLGTPNFAALQKAVGL